MGRLTAIPWSRWTSWARWCLGVGVAAIFGIGAWAYLTGLHLSLWHDEAFTVIHFIDEGPWTILFGRPYSANNHVLFSLLAWASAEAMGPTESIYRMWSVLPAIAAVATVSFWLWRRFNPIAALIFAVLAVMSPVHFQLARVARGYGLGMLAAACVLIFAHGMSQSERRSDLYGLALSGGLGVAVLPTFVLPFLFVLVTVGVLKRAWKRVGIAAVWAGGIGSIPYVTRLGEVLDSSGQEFGRQLQWFEPITAWVFHFMAPIGRLAVGQDPEVTPGGTPVLGAPLEMNEFYVVLTCFGMAAVAVVFLVLGYWRGERGVVALVLAPLFGTYVLIIALRFHVVGRFVSFLSVFALAGISLGVTAALREARRTNTQVFSIVLLGVIIGLGSLGLNFVQWAQDWHTLPYENFKDAAAIAEKSGQTTYFTNSQRETGLRHYLGEGLQPANPDMVCSMQQFVFIHHPFRNPPLDAPCLEAPDVTRAEVLQFGRGGYLEVFIKAPK